MQRWLVVSLVAAALGGGTALAEERDAESPPGGLAPTLHGKLRLSLSEAIAMGIENNLDVEIARHDPLIAREEAGRAWGAFDPEGFAEYGLSDVQTPIASSLQASGTIDERIYSGQSGVRGQIPWLGGSYELGFSGQEVKTNSSISTLSPEFRSTLAASLTLPLMRDFLNSEPWTQVKLTRIGVSISDEEFRRVLMDTVRDIEVAYWALIARKRDLEVAEKSLETARALLEQTRAQYEVGVVSRVEVVQAEAGVAGREFDRIVAENEYRSSQDQLIDLVLGPHLTATSELELVLTEEPERITIRDVDEAEAVRRALAQRPELTAAREAIRQREIELRFARNQRLPRLDVEGGYGFEGLAGRENPARIDFGGGGAPVALLVGDSFSETDDDFFSDDGARQWRLRGLFSIPLGNVEGRHEVARSELQLRRARTEARRVEQEIVLAIRDAARSLRSALQGLEAAERRELAAEEQLRAERVRLEHGESTPFDVLQREEDLVEAQSQRIGAQQDYQTSVTRLERQQGTILQSRRILVEEASALR